MGKLMYLVNINRNIKVGASNIFVVRMGRLRLIFDIFHFARKKSQQIANNHQPICSKIDLNHVV